MKYFITTSFEMDGHSSGSAMICDSAKTKEKYLKEILYDEENKTTYKTDFSTNDKDGSITLYGRWLCGEWSINILPFNTFKEITNKERFVRTG